MKCEQLFSSEVFAGGVAEPTKDLRIFPLSLSLPPTAIPPTPSAPTTLAGVIITTHASNYARKNKKDDC